MYLRYIDIRRRCLFFWQSSSSFTGHNLCACVWIQRIAMHFCLVDWSMRIHPEDMHKRYPTTYRTCALHWHHSLLFFLLMKFHYWMQSVCACVWTQYVHPAQQYRKLTSVTSVNYTDIIRCCSFFWRISSFAGYNLCACGAIQSMRVHTKWHSHSSRKLTGVTSVTQSETTDHALQLISLTCVLLSFDGGVPPPLRTSCISCTNSHSSNRN